MATVGSIKKIGALFILLGLSLPGSGQQLTDGELKKNVVPVQNALATIKQLEPKKFEFNTTANANLKLPRGAQYGFAAENIQQILPELVRSESYLYRVGKNDSRTATVQTTDLESLVPLLVAAIKEQQQQIDELKRQIEARQK